MADSWRWMAEAAPSERAFSRRSSSGSTPRAHADGSVEQIIEDALAFPHKPTPEAIQTTIDALLAHQTADRFQHIVASTLVLAGGQDICTPPRHGQLVADTIPDARFEVLTEEAHQPFQEVPDQFNARVDAFWREVDARA